MHQQQAICPTTTTPTKQILPNFDTDVTVSVHRCKNIRNNFFFATNVLTEKEAEVTDANCATYA